MGYDLYVQLVAEAVADAKGFHIPEVTPINLDVPGEAHLPKDYVEADDARLEAYRRLAGVTSMAELEDLRNEWIDRYGALPAATRGLLELAQLRLVCLDIGVTSVVVMPARVGVRSKPVLRLGPLHSRFSQQFECAASTARAPTTSRQKSCGSSCRQRMRRHFRSSTLLEELLAPTTEATQ